VKHEREPENEREHYGHHSFPAEGRVADAQVESQSHTADSADANAAHVENDVASNMEDASHVHEQDEQSLNGAQDDSALVADRQFSPEISDDRTTSEQ
jgi:hypothetical protein